MMTRWMLIVSGPDKVEDMHRVPDDVLSQKHAAIEVVSLFVFSTSSRYLTHFRLLIWTCASAGSCLQIILTSSRVP